MQALKKQQGLMAVIAVLAFLLMGYGLTAQPTTTLQAQSDIQPAQTHVNAEDFVWDNADVTAITLNDDDISITGEGATVTDRSVIITAAGNYSISGTLTDGQITVDTEDEGLVRLILNGVNISSASSAPINIINAKETLIVLADDTKNVLTDASVYVFATPEEDEPNAAVFSNGDLTIAGNGELTVNGNYNDAISTDDGLVITSGTLNINALDDGIRGKDYLVIEAGTLNVNAGGDGLKSDNEDDTSTGVVSVVAGTLNVNAGGDAITAQTSVLISGGTLTLVSGGGSTAFIDETLSAKGIKAAGTVQIDGGMVTINAADDALHANGTITINGGTFTLASGDDGVHADATLTINGGDIRISDSYEGLESAIITINGGNISLVASDDGVNVAGGTDGSGMMARPGRGGGNPDQFAPTATTSYYLYINGGYLVVDAAGDGLDANGAIEMSGGVVIVNGPTESMNGALDYDAWFNMSGGWLVTAGSAGMVQAPSVSSTQVSLLLNFDTVQAPQTLVHIQSSDGTPVLTFAPSKSYQSITFSSAELTTGASYEVLLGGTSDSAVTDGVYQGGTVSGGTLYTTFTVTDTVTMLGTMGGMGGMGGMGRGGGRP